MADNLESYFKKNLASGEPGEGNWNVPSDEVWEKVAPQISKKKGIFIPWKYLYLIGGLMIILSVALWFTTGDDADGDAPDAQTVSDAISSDNSGSESAAEPENYSVLGTELIISDSLEGNNAEIKKDTREEQILAVETSSSIEDSRVKQVKPEKSNSSQDLPAENRSNQIVDAGEIDKVRSRPEEIQKIAEGNIINKTAVPVSKEEPVKGLHKEPLDNKGKFGLGAFLVPTWTNTQISGDVQSGQLETSNMFLYSTNWGFELKYFISNRFTVVTGIERSEIRSWSKSMMDFDYDISTEYEMGNGEKENTSSVDMPTPFGKINTALTYRFPEEEEIPDGEPMTTTFETHQDIRYLSIPLGVEYNIIRANRFAWFVEGGVRYNRALRDATSFSSRVLHEGHDMNVVEEEMTNHPTFTENYLNYYLGTGLSYQFSQKFQVSGSGRYFGNITEVNLQDNVSTYVHGFNLKIGVIYIF
jgi:hypothetical protein